MKPSSSEHFGKQSANQLGVPTWMHVYQLSCSSMLLTKVRWCWCLDLPGAALIIARDNRIGLRCDNGRIGFPAQVWRDRTMPIWERLQKKAKEPHLWSKDLNCAAVGKQRESLNADSWTVREKWTMWRVAEKYAFIALHQPYHLRLVFIREEFSVPIWC